MIAMRLDIARARSRALRGFARARSRALRQRCLGVCLLALGCAALSPLTARADEAEVHYHTCLSHKKAGKLIEAERECKLAIDKRTTHVAARYTLGTIQRQTGQLDQALASFRLVRELEAKNSMGWAGEGAVLLRLDRIDEAVTALRQAVALDPKDIVSVGNLGNALRKQQKPEEAIITYKKALAANPDNVDILNNLAVAYRGLGRNVEAIETLKKALAKKPGDGPMSGNLAKALRAEKRYAEAIPHYETAIKAGGERDAGLWFDLAYSYEQTGRKDKAVDAYKRNLALIKDSDPKGAAYVEEVIRKLGG
jgi:tetratricopeptide (TPR) repeat protein